MSQELGLTLGSAASALFGLIGTRPELAPLLGPIGAAVASVAADLDHHVAHRLQQIEQVGGILRRARPLTPPELTQTVDQALAYKLAAPADFELPKIEVVLTTLKAALIEVHAWLESGEGRAHPDLLSDLWAFVEQDTRYAGRGVPTLW